MIITKTPMRISFTGGGTDLPDYYLRNGGAVVSTGIDKYIYIVVNRKFDNRIRVSYSKTEIVDEVEELHHELVRECLKLVGIRGGIEIVSIADIPGGTGLGSSGSFTVGLLNALHVYSGYAASSEELAREACHVELEVLGHPIGKQDQYAAAYGGMNYFRFEPDGSVKRERIRLGDGDIRKMQSKLVLFYTGLKHSADLILKEQKQNTAQKLETLDYMRDQAGRMHRELTECGFDERFGRALHDGWVRKRSLASKVTNDFIDACYERAMEAGAVGGKLLGAGGGGFLLFYCDEERQAALERAIGLERISFRISEWGSQVVCCV